VPPRKSKDPLPAPKPAGSPLAGPKPWLAYALLCLIALVAYSNSFGLGFALDGQNKVLTDARVQAATSQNLRLIVTRHYWWPRPADRLYRPVTLGSFLFNYAVLGNGASPTGYHITNLLLHMLNVCLLFELALLVLHKRGAALLAAALWAAHPVQTEAVANIAGRADLLSAAAVLGGLLIYIRSLDLAGRRKQAWVAGLFVVALAGVFSKENAAVLAGLMVLWDVAFGWERNPGWNTRRAAYIVVAIALCIMAIARWKIFEGEPWPEAPFVDNPIRGVGFLQGRLTAIAVIARYLGLLVWPAHLSFDYAYNQIPIVSLSAIGTWLAVMIVGAAAAIAIARYRSDRTIFWAAGFFAIALLPTSNLLFPIGSIMALRFLYLPSAGFAVAVVALAGRIDRPKVVTGLLVVAIAAFAARTLLRNPAWRNNLTLAAADVLAAPESFRTHQLLAEALNETDPRGNLDPAIREYETAVRILGPLSAENGCPVCLSEMGRLYYGKALVLSGVNAGEARNWFEKAVTMLEKARTVAILQARAFDDAQIAHGLPLRMTGDMDLYLYLARSYTRLGRPDDALRAYREAQGVDPLKREVYDEMATVFATQGKIEQAAVVIDEKAFMLGMNNATAASLRNLYARIPDGACALKTDSGTVALNLDCPRVRADMCLGWGELDTAYRAARQSSRADQLRAAAMGQYGCPSEAFAVR
jgi:protein O-mannosyl-transferase